MMKVIAAIVLLGMCMPAWAQRKSCDTLKGEIEAKLKAKGVTGYTLDIAAEAKDGKVVGACDGGSKKIIYRKGK